MPRTAVESAVTRQRLLQAAMELLSERSIRAIGIRDVALRAGVNSALVSYHFNGKEGLFMAVIDIATQPLIALDLGTLRALPPAQRTRVVVSGFVAICQSNRWLPRLLTDDQLTGSEALQEQLAKQVGSKLAKLLTGFVKLQQADGYFRDDLDPQQVGAALIGMLSFPFVASTLLERSLRLRPTQAGNEKWIDHVYRLLEQGCRAE